MTSSLTSPAWATRDAGSKGGGGGWWWCGTRSYDFPTAPCGSTGAPSIDRRRPAVKHPLSAPWTIGTRYAPASYPPTLTPPPHPQPKWWRWKSWTQKQHGRHSAKNSPLIGRWIESFAVAPTHTLRPSRRAALKLRQTPERLGLFAGFLVALNRQEVAVPNSVIKE